MDRVGHRLGPYHLHRLLGQGGYAEVYLGYHRYLQSPAAIKVLRQPLGRRAQQVFLLEAQTIAHLLHPHIVRVLDFGVEAHTPFLVLDYAPYGSLRQRYRPGRSVPLEEIVAVVQQVAQAIDFAHQAGRIHQDIKPENLLLGRHRQVWLSDFGLAIPVHLSPQHALVGLVGTMAYAAPEQLRGQPVPASDQYALGVVVYEWLRGQAPFVGPSLDLALQHQLTAPPPLCPTLPTLPRAVEEVVLTALAKDPDQRFPSVHAFAAALSQASRRAPLWSWPLAGRATSVLLPAAAGAPARPHPRSALQNRRSLLPAAQAASGRHRKRRKITTHPKTLTPPPVLPARPGKVPPPWRGRRPAGGQQKAAHRKWSLPVAPSVPPPRWSALERLVVGLLLLSVLCIGTFSARLGQFQPGGSRAPGSSAQANGAGVPPTLTSPPLPHSSAPGSPVTTPSLSPTSAPGGPAFPILRFDVTPRSFVDSCGTHNTALQPKPLSLDNTGSTLPVTWQVQITDTDHTGQLWATARPASGSVPAGQRANVLLLPASKLCQHTKGAVTYQVLLTYQGAGGAETIRITDLVAGP